MTTLTKSQAQVLLNELHSMNDYINTNGKIASSTFINTWHGLNNGDWQCIIETIRAMYEDDYIKLNSFHLRDLEEIENFLHQNYSHWDNILNPHPKDLPKLPKGLQRAFLPRYGKTMRSKLWSIMTQVRDTYTKDMLGINLPNEDSSKGKLDPTPKETLFE